MSLHAHSTREPSSLKNNLSVLRGKHKVWVTGVLYLHRITDNRFTQTADRVSSMLRNLCGDAAMSHVMLCTTMWDSVPEERANERFDELIGTGAWKEMIERGASTARISNTSANAKADAEEIVAQLIKNVQPIEMAIQDEMVNQGKTALQTGAGVIIEENELKAQDDDREQPAEAEPSVGTANEVPPFVHDPHAGPRDTAHNDNKTFREQGMQTSGDPVIVYAEAQHRQPYSSLDLSVELLEGPPVWGK